MKANTNSIVQVLYPVIENRMSSKTTAYRNLIGRYISRHSSELYAQAPYDRIIFTNYEWEDFYNTMGKDLEAVAKNAIAGTFYADIADFNPAAAKDEFTVIQMMIIRYFIIKNSKKDIELSSIYLAFSGKFYPSVHYGSFPVATPSEYKYVMDYVINHELTKKNDIISKGSVFGAIRSLCETWYTTYKPQIKSADDDELKDVIQQLRDRIKSFIFNIAKVYYSVYEKKDNLYLSYDSDSAQDDSFRIAENDSMIAEKFTETAMINITSNTVNIKYCKLASDNNVRTDEVKFIINAIQSDSGNNLEIKELIRLIITLYFQISDDKDVRTIEFVSKSLSSRPNSKNKEYLRQKEIIYGWLEKYSNDYRRRKSREATKYSYYTAVLTYYVLMINGANK